MAWRKGACGQLDWAAVHDGHTGCRCLDTADTVTCLVFALDGFQTVVQYTFMLKAWENGTAGEPQQ